MTTRRRVWPLLAAAGIGVAILVGLGAWQLQRLAWKEALLARIAERAEAAPVPLAEAIKIADADYLRAEARGVYRHDAERLMLATRAGGLAWRVVTPLITADGTALLVDRGLVPDGLRQPARRPETLVADPVTVIGPVLRHAPGRGAFTPSTDGAGNVWHAYEIDAMLAGVDGVPAPFVLHREPSPRSPPLPEAEPIGAGLRNNHLGYALTWFALAAILAVMTVAVIFGGHNRTPTD